MTGSATPKTWLVIGSNSFSGASFVDHLTREGHDVIGVSRSEEVALPMRPYAWPVQIHAAPHAGRENSMMQGASTRGSGSPETQDAGRLGGPEGDPPSDARPGRFRFQRIDLNHDLEALEALLKAERPDFVANFAAQSMVGESWQNPEHWMQTNCVAFVKLLELLRNCDWLERYVHITTPEVYGSTEGWVTEDHPFNPSTPYAVSRAAGDMALSAWSKAYGLNFTATRAANVYGPGQQLYRIVPRTVLYALTGQTLQLHGGGHSERSFIHIGDVSRATVLIAEQGEPGATYHISTDEKVSIRHLVEVILDRLGKPFAESVEIVGERLGKDMSYTLATDRLRALGWQAEIGLEQGLEAVIGWVQENLAALRELPQRYIHKP